MDYVAAFCEVDIISIILLIYLLARLKKNHSVHGEAKTLSLMAYSIILLAVTDIMWVIGEFTALPYSIGANWTVNTLYMLLNGLASYLWFVYNEQKLRSWSRRSAAYRVITALPYIVFAAMVLSSVETEWIFFVDDDNHFHDGDYHIIVQIVTLGYLIYAAASATVHARKQRIRAQKNEEFSLATFFILPLFFSMVHLIEPRIPYAAIGSALSMVFIYNKVQDGRIFTDGLTGLNNRRRADEYFDRKIDEHALNMVFILGDVNYFKHINDNFGHGEGDRALTIVSGALKKVCGDYDAFLARYGGDEFCIIWEMNGGRTPEQLIEDIQLRLTVETEKLELEYRISMSFGYAVADGRLTGTQILEAADRMMYDNKAAAHRELDA